MGFSKANENTEKTHKANISRGQRPLFFSVNKIVYSMKMPKKETTKLTRKVNVKKNKNQ
jgi:acyl-coenzyme A synthetase/AMP-(fatty) acid ligase